MLNGTLRITREMVAEVAIIGVALFFPLAVLISIAIG